MTLIEKVSLYYREGMSDKVYEIHMTRDEEGYSVTGYNGRRGTKLIAQPKTPRPVPYRTARYIFDNLEAAKLNHRRTPYSVAYRETPGVIDGSKIGRGETARHDGNVVEEHQVYAANFLDALEL
jgi:hypothetical protein